MSTAVCHDIFGQTHAVSTQDLTWRPAAYALVIQNNAVLLLRHADGRYDLPGGGVNLGERLEAAVIREVKEETGLEVGAPELVGVAESLFHAAHSDGGGLS